MYIIACDQFYQAFPMLVRQETNAGVRWPGYEARSEVYTLIPRLSLIGEESEGN